MRRLSLRTPSPSMAVAMMALFISLGGTGYAATQLGRSPAAAVAKKKKKPPAHPDSSADKKLFNSLFSALIPGAHVAFAASAGSAATAASATNATHATSADSATKATEATNAAHATSADSATNASQLGGVGPSGYQTAAKWVLVDAKGEKIIAQSGGITLHSHPFPGEYIIDFGSSVVGHALMVTPSGRDNSFVGSFEAAPCGTTEESYPNCSNLPTNDVHVDIEDTTNAKTVNASFYVVEL